MKKFYAFLAAALMSASLFAAPAKVPAVSDLANSGDLATDVILCLYFDEEVCNEIVLVGTYNNWSTDDVASLTRFEKLENFDGWYVASFPWAEGAEGKAVQLKKDGSFDWKFQTGDVDAWIHQGGSQAKIEAGYDGESNVSYEAAGAYIYEIAYFKLHNSPCESVPTHKYTIVFFDPWCEENPEFVPAIAGDFNNWAPQAMSAGTFEGDEAWLFSVETEEGNSYKFLEFNRGWANEFQKYDEENDAWNKLGNSAFPVASKDTTIVVDYSDLDLYRYAQCGVPLWDTTKLELVVVLKAPAGSPAAGVELMGDFGEDTWNTGIMMTPDNENNFRAEFVASEANQIKFREAGNWDNAVCKANGDELDNFTVGAYLDSEKKKVEIDLSDAEKYAWKANVEGIENIVLTEKARKVVVDGVLYIVRDNKLFNVQGTQIR